MSRIVLTGGPGAGKTALVLALQARGYTIVGDAARIIIQDRRRRGLSPRPDGHEFVQEVLRMDIDSYVWAVCSLSAGATTPPPSRSRCATFAARW